MVNYKPDVLDIQITKKCNARCRFCGIGCGVEKNKSQKDLPTETVLNCIDQAYDLGFTRVDLTGGEPLLRYEEVKSFLSYATSKGMQCGFVTNAYFAKSPERGSKVARELKDAGLKLVALSLDEDHQKYVPPGHVLNAVRGFMENDVKVFLKTTQRLETFKENYKLLERMAKKLGGEFHRGDRKKDSKISFGGKKIVVEENFVERAGKAKNLDRRNFPGKRPVGKSYCLTTEMLVKNDGTILPCSSVYSESVDSYFIGNIDDIDLRTAIRKANDSVLDLIVSPYGLIRIDNVLGKSKDPGIRRMGNKKWVSECDFCSQVFSNPKSRDFILSEFNRFKGAEPKLVFRDGELVQLNDVRVSANGQTIDLKDYLGPLSIKDFFTAAYEHDLAVIEEEERRGEKLEKLKKEAQKELEVLRGMTKAAY